MAPSFSSYLTRLISALAKAEAMLPRIIPKRSFPNTITRLARAVQREENQSLTYRAFSHDVMGAILVFQNNETAAVLMSQTNPVGVEGICYVNTSFCSNRLAWLLATGVKTLF